MQTVSIVSDYSTVPYEPHSLGRPPNNSQTFGIPSQHLYSLPLRCCDSAPMTPSNDFTTSGVYYPPSSPHIPPYSVAPSVVTFGDAKTTEMQQYPLMAPYMRMFAGSDSLESSHDDLLTPVSAPDESLYGPCHYSIFNDFDLPRLASSASDSTDSEDELLDGIGVSPRSSIVGDNVLMFNHTLSTSLISAAPSPVTVGRISSNYCGSSSVPEIAMMPTTAPVVTSSSNEDSGIIVRDYIQRRGRKPSLIEDPTKAFVCAHCNRRFRRHEHLKRHFRSLHTREKPFKCEECSKSFSRSDNLAQHIRTHARGGQADSADDNEFENDSDISEEPSGRRQRFSTSAIASPYRRRASQLSTSGGRSAESRRRTRRATK
ncbi:hypothetical protein V1525DRAFT_440848 [Lipomyces kononenkoae]|uniref:Uncharacterized protein n=1 Tax=Lipomyces kononenkoae TaxID=34357 RepID=A0ACC3T323_LIPKO